MKNHNLHSKKSLHSYRKRLRNNSTSAESIFWNIVKNRKLEGRKFRRQHSIGNYIVDFYCPSDKIIIELDGDPHGEYHKISMDIERDKRLQKLGYTVLRFENRFVFQEQEYVINEIKKHLTNHPVTVEHLIIEPNSGRATPP